MPQLMLPLEFVLLAAMAYMYWTTRKLISESQKKAPDPSQTGRLEDTIAATEMSQNLTALLAELESTASCAHNDLIRRNTQLQETLKQAEAIRSELRSLLDKAERPLIAPGGNEEEVMNPGKFSKTPEDGSFSLTLAEALTNFGNYLQESDRSEGTISRLTSDVRGFITWLGGQRYEEVLLGQIGPTEIGSYLDYLRSQDYKASTVKSKQGTLRVFSEWVDIQLSSNGNIQENPGNVTGNGFHVNKPVTNSSPTPSQNNLANSDRYQVVFTLANQGVDQSAIAAHTGLEQEAIRMLLATRVQPGSLAQ